jgi:NAD(P)-dependent dehydrogenase (short-subunit alcohol dehydrogenase family)
MRREPAYIAAACGLGVGMLLAKSRLRRRASDIRGQVVLITGGSRGLGFAMAREFGKLGCRVAICARSRDQLEEAAALLRKEGINAYAVPCDVTDLLQVQRMANAVREHFGRIDILVNNAGEILVAPMENHTIEDFRKAMEVMFWGVLYPTLTVLPQMRARGSGRIAAITSIGGKVSVPHLSAYSCAKFAAVAFFEGLRAEMAPYGIRVTTIAPGLMRTGSYVNARFKGYSDREAAWFSAAASLPGISMGAERAARQAVKAIRTGAAEKILSTPANLLARIQGAFPGLVPEVMSVVNRLLPGPADGESQKTGTELQAKQGRVLDALTVLGRRAGARLNQATT